MGHNEPLRKSAFDQDASLPIANGSATRVSFNFRRSEWEEKNAILAFLS